jgi:beta-glucanase (GH16 family)
MLRPLTVAAVLVLTVSVSRSQHSRLSENKSRQQNLRFASDVRESLTPETTNNPRLFSELVWSDEFDDGIGSDWIFDIGGNGWGNHELQFYRRENAFADDGILVIVAKHEKYGGKEYTSARLKTQHRKSWRHGRIEARIRVATFKGAWAAFRSVNSIPDPTLHFIHNL